MQSNSFVRPLLLLSLFDGSVELVGDDDLNHTGCVALARGNENERRRRLYQWRNIIYIARPPPVRLGVFGIAWIRRVVDRAGRTRNAENERRTKKDWTRVYIIYDGPATDRARAHLMLH